MEPSFAPAGAKVKIIKSDDPNFGVSPVAVAQKQAGGAAGASYSIGADMKPTYGMPSGPGFEQGDPAGHSELAGAARRKRTGRARTRTFPRGILKKTHKIMPVADPARAPSSRRTSVRHSVRILSASKVKEARKSAKSKAAKTDIATIRRRLVERKIISPDKKNVPPSVLRVLYADAVGAGLLS
jgi:hypothetical protein